MKMDFFPWPKLVLFNKIISKLFENASISVKQVGCANFSGIHDYLEDPPWLGPTKKILKNRESKIG